MGENPSVRVASAVGRVFIVFRDSDVALFLPVGKVVLCGEVAHSRVVFGVGPHVQFPSAHALIREHASIFRVPENHVLMFPVRYIVAERACCAGAGAGKRHENRFCNKTLSEYNYIILLKRKFCEGVLSKSDSGFYF